MRVFYTSKGLFFFLSSRANTLKWPGENTESVKHLSLSVFCCCFFHKDCGHKKVILPAYMVIMFVKCNVYKMLSCWYRECIIQMTSDDLLQPIQNYFSSSELIKIELCVVIY